MPNPSAVTKKVKEAVANVRTNKRSVSPDVSPKRAASMVTPQKKKKKSVTIVAPSSNRNGSVKASGGSKVAVKRKASTSPAPKLQQQQKKKRRVIEESSDDNDDDDEVVTAMKKVPVNVDGDSKKKKVETGKAKNKFPTGKDFIDDEAEEDNDLEEEEAEEEEEDQADMEQGSEVEEEESADEVEAVEEEEEEEAAAEEEEEEEEEEENGETVEQQPEEEEEVEELKENKIEAEVDRDLRLRRKRACAAEKKQKAAKIEDHAWTEKIMETIKLNKDVEEGQPMEVVDVSAPKAVKIGVPSISIELGEGFKLTRGMVSFVSGGQHGSFEAVSLVKSVPPTEKVKTPHDLVINYPIRCFEALLNSIKGIRKGIGMIPKLPTTEDLFFSEQNDKCDLSPYASSVPKLAFRVDELYTIASENVKWGKASVDVITFTKFPKERAKKTFSLQLPFRLFKSLERGLQYLEEYPALEEWAKNQDAPKKN